MAEEKKISGSNKHMVTMPDGCGDMSCANKVINLGVTNVKVRSTLEGVHTFRGPPEFNKECCVLIKNLSRCRNKEGTDTCLVLPSSMKVCGSNQVENKRKNHMVPDVK